MRKHSSAEGASRAQFARRTVLLWASLLAVVAGALTFVPSELLAARVANGMRACSQNCKYGGCAAYGFWGCTCSCNAGEPTCYCWL